MKKHLKLVVGVVAFFVISSGKLFSQTHTPAVQELILEIPAITEKGYAEIKNALSSIDGVTLVGYCDQYKCFLIYYDTNKIQSGSEVAKAVENLNDNYKTQIKEGASIATLIGNCNAFPVTPIGEAK